MANIRISQLPSAQTAITGTELVPIVQNGETVQTTVSAIVNSPVQTQTFLTINNEPTLPNSRYLAVGAGLSLADGGAQSSYAITPVGALASLVNAGQGFMVKSSGTSLVNRSIAISGNGLSIVNGDGTTGNPTIALTNNVANLAGASGTGLLAIAGNNALSTVTIVGVANQISITNGNTSPVIGIASNPIFPGTASITLPSGGTGARPSGINGMLRYNSDLNALETYANGAWGTIVSGSGVSSFSAGTTGLTPSSGATGAVVLAGTLNASSGGTGISGTLTGIPYANGTSAYTTATTAQLLTLLGTTPIANGGTGQTTASSAFNALSPITTTGDLIYGSSANTSSRLPIGTTNQVLTVVGGIPAWGSVAGVAVTSFSAGSTGLSPAAPTSGAVTLSGTLAVANGGTGLSSTPANGQIDIGNGTGFTRTTLTAGTGISITNSSGSITIAINGTGEVTSFSGGTTGLTPNTPTGGAITLSGILNPVNGGSGVAGTLTGILYGNGTSAYTTASTAQVLSLIGTLPIANGGTGITSLGTGVQTALGQNVTGSGGFALAVSPSFTTPILGVATATSLTVGTLTYTPANALITAQSSATAYNQVIIQNSNNGATASADYIVNNNNSTDSTYYGDFGMNSGGFTGSGAFNAPNTVYLTATTGDLAIGTTTANAIHFVVNGGTTDSATVNGTTGVWTYASTINGSITGNAGTLTLSAGSGTTNYITYSSSATGNVSQFTSSGLTYNATNTALTGGINGGTF